MNEKIEIQTLFQPKKLWGYLEISANKNIIPETPGIYAWYFRNFPAEIPTDNCIVDMGLTLLYLGIVPRNSFSSQTLRDRIHRHLTGNAEGSTLRLSLGCILDDELNIQLRRVGSGKSKTFA
ncbi:hypothetical protein H8E77_21770 [bacterium]|nr:hypothetical protein [bacterium]